MNDMTLYLIIALAPLVGPLIAGLFDNETGRIDAHMVTILGVAVSTLLSAYVLRGFFNDSRTKFGENVYTRLAMGGLGLSVGFLVNTMTAMMMVVVTDVSLIVHTYTIGYMHDEKTGCQRFFDCISLFTFSMLMLIMSSSSVQPFFGWEAVSLMSYLLIGFYFKRPNVTFANLKASLINRVSDFDFLLGIDLALAYFGSSLRCQDVFAYLPNVQNATIQLFPGVEWSLVTVTCLLLFVDTMGKPVQFPLHVWLLNPMKDPTPVFTLTHAATMITVDLFMVSRMPPIYKMSSTVLSVIMVIGAITALFIGSLSVIQNDIKRAAAYSTLSQLGHMTATLDASAYLVVMSYMMTHVFLKALLFLAAGNVIIGMRHDQDICHMNNLRKYTPITWPTMLIGNLSLIGTSFLPGFYSKDSIIEAAGYSILLGSGFTYFAVPASTLITVFYAFRQYFMVFHGEEKWRSLPEHHDDNHGEEHHGLGKDDNPHESPLAVTLPLILPAILSVIIGYVTIEPTLYGDFFKDVILINADVYPTTRIVKEESHGTLATMLYSLHSPVFYFVIAGVLNAWLLYVKLPRLPAKITQALRPAHVLFKNKYYLDALYFNVFAKGTHVLGTFFQKVGDTTIIDSGIANGSAKLAGTIVTQVRKVQAGSICTYTAAMIFGVLVLLGMTFWGLFR